jgi:hypothetical protein
MFSVELEGDSMPGLTKNMIGRDSKCLKSTSIFLFCCLLSGCVSVGFSQYEALKQRILPPSSVLDKYQWDMMMGDYQTEALAISAKGKLVFTSQAGDALLFDGFMIRQINQLSTKMSQVKWERDESLNATKGKFIYRVLVDGQLYETIECEGWQTVSAIEQVQVCQGKQTYTTKQRLDMNNNLLELHQDLPFYNDRLSLVKR